MYGVTTGPPALNRPLERANLVRTWYCTLVGMAQRGGGLGGYLQVLSSCMRGVLVKKQENLISTNKINIEKSLVGFLAETSAWQTLADRHWQSIVVPRQGKAIWLVCTSQTTNICITYTSALY